MKTVLSAVVTAVVLGLSSAPASAQAASPEMCSALGVLMNSVAVARDAGVPFTIVIGNLRENDLPAPVYRMAAAVYQATDLSPAEVESQAVLGCLSAREA